MRRIIGIIVIIICAVSFIVCNLSNIRPITLLGKARLGTPFFFNQNVEYFSKIIDYAVCSNRVYILYSNDVLKCLDEEGNYLFSVFFDRKRNGISSLHVVENELYYEDGCQHHLYQIIDYNEFTFFDHTVGENTAFCDTIIYTKKVKNEEGVNGLRLVYKNYNLFLCRNDEEKSITNRSVWMHLIQINFYMVFFVIVLAITFIVIVKKGFVET